MYQDKALIIFDLDGTLAESKSEMDKEMSLLLAKLLEKKKVAVISGGSYEQFKKQFLGSLNCPPLLLKNLFLFPTCSTQFYKFGEVWERVYAEELTGDEIKQIMSAFDRALDEYGFDETELCCERIENRGTQVTFSALGQKAPLDRKAVWDPDQSKRLQIKKLLDRYIPEFEVRVGGSTSIDVTRKGIDKAYAIKQISETLGVSISQMLFIGDALFEGGNDYPVKTTGTDCIQVAGPGEAKKIIQSLIS